MSADTTEIKQLFPQGKEVSLKSKPVMVKPFGFGKFPKVLKLLKDIKTENDLPADIQDLNKVRVMDVASLIANNAEVVVELCALAINEKLPFFDDLPSDEGIELCQAVIEVNADFFITRLQPQLLKALSGLSTSVGGLLSQDSSQTATV